MLFDSTHIYYFSEWVFGASGQSINKEMLQRLKQMTGSNVRASAGKGDTLSKASLKSLSFVNKNQPATIEEEAMSTKTGTSSRNQGGSMSRAQTVGGFVNLDPSNIMENFLQNLSSEMRRVVSRITGV